MCCAGKPLGGGRGLAPAARALLDAGIVLGELVVDERDRVVSVSTLPRLTPATVEVVADGVARWTDAALGG